MKKRILSILLTLVMVIGMLPTVALAAASDFTKITVGGTNVVPGGTTSGSGWTYMSSTLSLNNYQGGPIVIEAENYNSNALIFDINVSGICNVSSGNEPYAIHFKAPKARAVTLRINLEDGASLKAVGNLLDGIGVTTDESDTTNPYLEINGPTSGSASVYVSGSKRGIALNTKYSVDVRAYRGGYVTVKNNVTLYATGSLYAIETGHDTKHNYDPDVGPTYNYLIPHLTVKGNAVVELYSNYAALNAVDVEQIDEENLDGHKITTKKSGDIPTYVLIAPETYVAVSDLSVDPTSLELDVNETQTLTATVTPNNATNKDVIWTSSNPAVATVDANGKVTAVAAGSANIVASTVSGNRTVWCPVTVTAPAPEYTISFASNGYGSMTDVSVGETQNYKYTLPTSTFSLPNANYEFAYWAVPGIGEKQPGDVIDVTSDMTIVAVHTAKDSGSVADAKYTVTYTDGVDGEVIFDTQTFSDKAYGSVTPTFDGVPERAGYTFKGWSPAVASHVTEDATYKATWEINEYEVSFWTYEGSGSMSAVTKEYGAEYTLPDCGFTAPTGKSFDGWSINGETKDSGDKITVTSNVVVNAVWKNESATTYTIVITDGVPGEDVFSTYNGDTTYVKNANGDFVAELNADADINGPFGPTDNYKYVRNGYDFAGWSPELELYFTTATGNVTYTATWTPKEYTIAFWSQYGTESMSSVNKNTGDAFTFPECEYTPPNGFAFSHWTISTVSDTQYKPGDTITIDKDTIPDSGSSIEVTANWQNSYNLSLSNCKANGTSVSAYYVPGTEIYLVANDPQPGYVFDKWVVTTDYSTDEVAISSLNMNAAITTFKMPAQGIRVTATYKASDAPYNVTLITNGGTIESGDVTSYVYGTGATLPTAITRDGYTFEGWYDNAAFSGDKVTAISNTATGDKIFYAKWTSNAGTPPQPPVATTTYTVTVNGGSGSGEYEAEEPVTLTAYEPLTGFVFDKWEVDGVTVSDVNAKTISFEMPENAVTATATYKQVMIVIHKVTFNSDGGSTVDPQFIQNGDTATEPATDPTKEGFTFEGWYLGENEYDFATPVTEPITLTAKWKEVTTDPEIPTTTFVTVVKEWDVPAGTVHPDAVSVVLKVNGKDYGEPVTLNEENEWTCTWKNLPVNNEADGDKIDYTVDEVEVPEGYTKSIEELFVPAGKSFEITNIYNVAPDTETINIAGRKTWVGDEENYEVVRPASIVVNLLANGDAIREVEVAASTQWTYSFNNLPKYDEAGEEITYTVQEEAVEGYTATYDGFNITNTYNVEPEEETTSVTVVKEWVDGEGANRPQTITVILKANGQQILQDVLSERNNWTTTFENLPVNSEADGAKIDYTVDEVEVPTGYTKSIGNLVVPSGIGFEITNTKDVEPEPITIEIPVSKVVTKGGNTNFSGSETFTFEIEVLNSNTDTEEMTVTDNTVSVADMTGGSTVIKISIPEAQFGNVCDEGILITEKAGNADGWTYDATVWHAVYDRETGWKFAVHAEGDAPVEPEYKQQMTFTNTYTKNVSTGGGGGGSAAPSKPVLNKEDHFAFLAGYTDGTFGPERNMTRGEVATMFARLLTDKMDMNATYENSFSDVPADYWAYNFIGYVQKFGLISGYSDGTFRPDAPITRAEFATIACRFEELTEGTKTFSDVPETYWAYRFISYAAERGWVSGYTDGTFRPDNYITRAEVVTVTCRLLERNADKDYINKNIDDLKTFPDVDEDYWAYWFVMEATNGHDYTKKNDKETWSSLHK